MKAIQFIFGTYNEHSIGSLSDNSEMTYQRALKPFLSVLNQFPKFPAVLFYSGILLDWITRNHPEFLMLLADMVNRRQIELLTGGYYEPVFPLIPRSDMLGQIEKLTTFLRSQFGRRPHGNWLTESVWEPSLASILNTSGIEYTFLRDEHFKYAGLQGDDLYYPCLTENQGKSIVVFPLSSALERVVSESSVDDAVDFILSAGSESKERVVVLLESGEKFGKSEGSYERLYDEGWLKSFLQSIQEKSDAITPVNPSRYVRQVSPIRKIYFPTTFYSELMQWLSSDAKAIKTSKRKIATDASGGLFQRFLNQYPESNLMYSKMLYTHLRVNQIRGDKFRKKTAREELWKGQCHVAYWHGKCGGIYWSHLRKLTYRAFIEAETMARADGMFTSSITSFDFDMDGKEEYLYQSKELNAYVHCEGGMVFELDFIPTKWNYCDTLARRPEVYHDGNDRHYDWYMWKAFIDHFFSQEETIGAFDKMTYKELGDFVTGRYDLGELDREHLALTMTRTGQVTIRNRSLLVRVEKSFRFKNSTIQASYVITNQSTKGLDCWFGTELNLAFASGESSDMAISKFEKNKKTQIDGRMTTHSDVKRLLLQDLRNSVSINLSSDTEFSLWALPLEAVTWSDGASEKIYQSNCVVARWHLSLGPDESWKNSLSLAFTKLDKKKTRSRKSASRDG